MPATHRTHLVDTTLFHSPTSGGVKRYLTAKHRWLRDHTPWLHSILVPGTDEHIERGGMSSAPGVRVPGTFDYRMPRSIRRWRAALDALEPDLIEAGDPFQPAWCALQVAERRGIPSVAFYHSNLPQIVGLKAGWPGRRALERYVRSVYSRFDAVFAPSRAMCERLRALGVRQTQHQPLGVDAEVFSPASRSADLRAELGLSLRTRLLIYAGRLAEEKNLPVLLDAFVELGAPYHLLVIGGHRTARPRSNVTLLPYRRDSAELARLIASADALVHAGTHETFGLIVLEAMACARPVVAARAGAFPELIDDAVGLLAEPRDARGTAEAVAALYERDLEAMGRAARAKVLKEFTWDRVFPRQLGAYARLLGARHGDLPAPARAVELSSPSSS